MRQNPQSSTHPSRCSAARCIRGRRFGSPKPRAGREEYAESTAFGGSVSGWETGFALNRVSGYYRVRSVIISVGSGITRCWRFLSDAVSVAANS